MERALGMNQLEKEKSPYLRQHAANPVEWHAWNDASLALAKKSNKPIFLSIGYSTCHWCHVMAHESFESEKTAELMNKGFFNIKVDREERPDVDAIYMTAVQALTGSGGWPMSVWLTPDLKPFYAGTYFPPDDRYGRPGFPSVLAQLSEIWEKENAKVVESANQITEMIQQYAGQRPGAETALDAAALMDNAFASIKAQFEPVHGGFSPAPKFPMPVYMDFLLEYHRRTKNQEALRMTATTMEKIAAGGIYDQLGGGFARYSTDERWVVPHFEKMLYDNAQLISVTAGLYQQTNDAVWKNLTENALQYVLRDLMHPDGGFFSAEDADSEGKEGTFYLWTLHEVRQHLTAEEADAFIARYGVTVDGNFMDPHIRETGKNVLVKSGPVKKPLVLAKAEQKLLAVRNNRPRPHRDEKIITEWNGLMISALAKAALALRDNRYRDAAVRAAQFARKNVASTDGKQLFRSWCDGVTAIAAQQSDYAMFIQGLLDLHEAAGGKEWLDWAVQLQETHERSFFDEELGGYFMNVARPDLLVRMKDSSDNVIPSGNSIAIRNGFRLARLTGKSAFRDNTLKTVRAFSSRLKSQPVTMVSALSALEL